MTNGEKIYQVALAEIGTKESPANTNNQKYGAWFGWNGVAWCAIFVSWCYANAGFQLTGLGWPKGFAGCMDGVSRFTKLGWLTNKPAVGDIVFFDWNSDGRWDHTGIFAGDIDGVSFKTIEGNTSLTNQSNGGEVMERKRKYGSNVLFVHPEILDK